MVVGHAANVQYNLDVAQLRMDEVLFVQLGCQNEIVDTLLRALLEFIVEFDTHTFGPVRLIHQLNAKPIPVEVCEAFRHLQMNGEMLVFTCPVEASWEYF